MNRSLLLIVLGAALVAGIAFRAFRTGPETSPGSAAPATEGQEQPKPPGPASVEAPEGDRAPTAPADSAATAATARADAPSTRRPITLYERDTVRELIKLHVDDGGREDKGELGSSLPEPAWPVDEDSLFLKYGSFDKERIQRELSSTQAILDWQSEGPFEDKAAELLPPPLLRAFELEREWLIQRLQDM